MQLLAWAQAWAATCGSQHSCLVEGQPKALSVGWRQVASRTANAFWHGLKEHLVPLCGPTTEGQRMCFLAAAPWPGLSSPYGTALTETENPTFLLQNLPQSQHGTHSAPTEWMQVSKAIWHVWKWRGGLSGRDRLRGSKQDVSGAVTAFVLLGCCHILQCL